MVPKRYHVVVVGEGDNSFGIHLGHWEQVLEYIDDALAQLRGEVVENQVRVCFRHVGYLLLDVVSQHHVLQPEVDSRPYRQMAQDHAVGHASVLVQNDHIGQVFVQAQADQVLHDVGAPVDALGIGDHDGHLLEELHESVGGVPGGGDQDLGVRVYHVGVLVVHVGPGDQRVEVVGLQLLLKLLLLAEQLGGQTGLGLLGVQDLLLLLGALLEFGLALEGEQVLAALADVFPQHSML